MSHLSCDELRNSDFQAGTCLLFNKPRDWTSFDVVNKVRGIIRKYGGYKKIKVGHAGTLDPMATGLLILCTGKFTKTIDSIQGQEKTYLATMTLGATTPSYDAESEIDNTYPTDHIKEQDIFSLKDTFSGEIDQRPPAYSAIHIKGQRAYKLARRGEEVILPLRKITIFELEFLEISFPEITFRVRCSKGTYIRSLAYDMGIALGSGAYLSKLVREKIGDYDVADALSIEGFQECLFPEES
jgi:tRNA pseudouridine55 synthase